MRYLIIISVLIFNACAMYNYQHKLDGLVQSGEITPYQAEQLMIQNRASLEAQDRAEWAQLRAANKTFVQVFRLEARSCNATFGLGKGL